MVKYSYTGLHKGSITIDNILSIGHPNNRLVQTTVYNNMIIETFTHS